MKKNYLFHIACFVFILNTGCSQFSVKTEIEKSDSIEKFKKSGLLLRVSNRSRLSIDEHVKNISHWFSGYKPIINISLFSEISKEVNSYDNETQRFYQTSISSAFLKYKSIGVVNLYLKDNRAELKKIISDNKLDGLLIFEVYNVLSTEMQFMDFNSVLVIVDKNLNLLYLDHQINEFDFEDLDADFEFDLDKIKGSLLNYVSRRLLEKLLDLDFMEKSD